MKAKPNILRALDRLASTEQAFLLAEFLAPVAGRGSVGVRIDGVRVELRPTPAGFRGWGVFRPKTHRECALVRPATLPERRQYLDLFPGIRLIPWVKDGGAWVAILAGASDASPGSTGAVAVRLMTDADLFDTVLARFDGAQYWHDRVDPRCDPATAAYLRRSLVDMVDPARIERPGLTAGQRVAYAMAFRRRADAMLADGRHRGETRLRTALAHAGAVLRDFAETPDGYRVSYDVDGERHTSVVRADLTVQSAGICLSGEDRKFDLGSLVGVLREGRDQIW